MAKEGKKNIKLRAFRIDNPFVTEMDSGVLKLLAQILDEGSTAQSRRMKLNEQDEDEDLLSDFAWQKDKFYVFGMMLRIIPGDNGGRISDDLFSHNKINISELVTPEKAVSLYKEHYYFAINNTHLVTNLSGSYSIDRLETYINWLLESVRKGKIFAFTPEMTLPDELKLSEIKDIEIGGSSKVIANVKEEENFVTKIQDLASDVVTRLFKEVPTLNEIQQNQLISAKLILKLNGKPKDMSKEDFQRIMGSIVKPMSSDSGISVTSKSGKKYRGDSIKKVKDVIVETTSQNRIVEEQLKQKMELFLSELKEVK